MSSVYETIRTRRTIRKFQQKSIPEHVLLRLIDAARLAPSAANRQPCEYLVTYDPTLNEQLFGLLKWAAAISPHGNPQEGEKPVAYIIVLLHNTPEQPPLVDAASGIMNLILSAWELGIGSCWLGSIDRDQIRVLFKIPESISIAYVVALGYPAEHPVVDEVRDSIRYWKDTQGTLHVPKRPLEQICFKDSYGKRFQCSP